MRVRSRNSSPSGRLTWTIKRPLWPSRAAANKQAPVLVEVSNDEVQMLGLHNVRCLVDNYRHEYGIEMYLNLDHAPSVEAAQAGIDAGFEFIHIDFAQFLTVCSGPKTQS